MQEELWFDFDADDDDDDDSDIIEYDITSAPNDFNTKTIFDFIESGSVIIPAFQRNYVWDIRRASKLIESLVIGIPVPQVFLYEESRNRFLVIDGQQRLMSIYYFVKQRFPKKEKRAELRRVFDSNNRVPDEVLADDNFFDDFNLWLPRKLTKQPNKLHGKRHSTLGDMKTTFDLRTIRNMIIKQLVPKDDDSSIYELFNRLNTGGMNLTPQEIRVSMYHSDFYDMLHRINAKEQWRDLLGLPEPDLRMKDIEFLLRGFAMLAANSEYKPSMKQFLHRFSRMAKKFSSDAIEYFERLFAAFLDAAKDLDSRSFHGKTGRKFNISMFEAIFTAACSEAYESRTTAVLHIDRERVERLRNDDSFAQLTKSKTADTSVVHTRLKKAKDVLLKNDE